MAWKAPWLSWGRLQRFHTPVFVKMFLDYAAKSHNNRIKLPGGIGDGCNAAKVFQPG